MTFPSDRIAGIVAILASATITLEARTYRVGFYTDPLGPGGLPFLVAALLGVAGLILMLRPQPTAVWPPAKTIARGFAAVLSLIVYAALLPVLGFIVSTTAVVAGLSVVFGGPAWRSVALAGAYTVVLYLLFSYVLGLALPIGSLFLRPA